MPDISMRFHKEALVLSSPIKHALKKYGIKSDQDLCIANVLEAETIKNSYLQEVAAGAQCIVLNSYDLLQANLAHLKLDDRIEEIALSALKTVNLVKPQHVLVELGPTELPLDDSSKNSLLENKNQYVNSARIFENFDKKYSTKFDAYYLKDLQNITAIKCALMGLRQVSDKPVFICAKSDIDGRINKNEDVYDLANVAYEFGASVVGISCGFEPEVIAKICKRIRAACDLPILAEIEVSKNSDTPYYYPDTMQEAYCVLHKAGVQFLRAAGESSPAYTAVLSACSMAN